LRGNCPRMPPRDYEPAGRQLRELIGTKEKAHFGT